MITWITVAVCILLWLAFLEICWRAVAKLIKKLTLPKEESYDHINPSKNEQA